MQSRIWKWLSGTSALALVLSFAPSALAQCGLPNKPIRPSRWQPRSSAVTPLLRLASDDWDDHEPSIIGMWHVTFTAFTQSGVAIPAPGAVIDNSLVVWHSDGTEIMNSSRPAQDGNICFGIWERTGRRSYFLNHIPWQGNDPSNAPAGIGVPAGGGQLLEKIILSPDGKSYSGTFSLTAYDPSGNVTVSFTGNLSATRVTISTPFSALL